MVYRGIDASPSLRYGKKKIKSTNIEEIANKLRIAPYGKRAQRTLDRRTRWEMGNCEMMGNL